MKDNRSKNETNIGKEVSDEDNCKMEHKFQCLVQNRKAWKLAMYFVYCSVGANESVLV